MTGQTGDGDRAAHTRAQKLKLLHYLFYPRNAAVIGASADVTKWGGLITNHVALGGFEGPLYPVNPKGGRILGIKVYPTLAAVPEDEIDLVAICRPAPVVPDILQECATKNVKFVILITAGFAETGEEGRVLQQQVVEMAEELGIGICGPNTMGILSNRAKLLALGSPIHVPSGGVSMISQSGNIGLQLLAWAQEQGVGVNKFISSGNEGMYTMEDYLEYLEGDDGTRVILLYLEGLEDPRRFLEVARRVSHVKPIVAFKAGKTDVGARAAMSHSGHLAGSEQIASAAFRQSGVIEAETTGELLDYAKAFEFLPVPKGNRVAIMTRGGGWGVITADACHSNGLELAELSADTIEALDELLPPFWSRSNPVDLVGTFDLGVHAKTLSMLIDSDDVDAVISLGSMTGFSSSAGIVDMVRNLNPIGYVLNHLQRAFFIWWSSLMMTPQWLKTAWHLLSREHQFVRSVGLHVEELRKPVVSVSLMKEKRSHRGKRTVVTYTAPEQATKALAGLYRYHLYLKNGSRQDGCA